MVFGYKSICEYVKDSKGHLVGCLYAYRDDTSVDTRVRFGWSKYATNKERMRFSKQDAFHIAFDRAYVGRTYYKKELPFAIQNKMDHFSHRALSYFKEEMWNYKED